MTKSEFIGPMEKLFAAQGREARHETVDVYFNSLQKMSLEQFEYAVKRSIENEEQFPKIPKLWAYAREIRKTSEESTMFSFMCPWCESSFAVRVDDLTYGSHYPCSACETYLHRKVSYPGEMLKKAMDVAVSNGNSIAYL